MTFVRTITSTLQFNTHTIERTVIIGGKLSNPKSIECQLVKSIQSGIIEFVDPTGKTLIHTGKFGELLREYHLMVQDYFEFLDIISNDDGFASPDKQLKDLKETLEKDALKDEVVAFLDEHPEYVKLIQKLREHEDFIMVKSLIDKFMKGTPSFKTSEKLISNSYLDQEVDSKIQVVSRFIPMPDISSRTLIVIFNSTSTSLPKTPELISIIKNRNDNVIVIEPSTPKSTFFRISDLYPENFSALYHTKSRSVFKNFH